MNILSNRGAIFFFIISASVANDNRNKEKTEQFYILLYDADVDTFSYSKIIC